MGEQKIWTGSVARDEPRSGMREDKIRKEIVTSDSDVRPSVQLFPVVEGKTPKVRRTNGRLMKQ